VLRHKFGAAQVAGELDVQNDQSRTACASVRRGGEGGSGAENESQAKVK
jgi:hypothetical protein